MSRGSCKTPSPVKTALLDTAASQLLIQLIQIGIVATTRPSDVAVAAVSKNIDFSGQASFVTTSCVIL